MLEVRFSHAPKIDDAAAGDLDEVPHAAGGHGLADEVQVRVLMLLTLANGSRDAWRRKFGGRWMSRVRSGDNQRVASGEIVRDFLPAVVDVISLYADSDQAIDDFRKGKFAGQCT